MKTRDNVPKTLFMGSLHALVIGILCSIPSYGSGKPLDGHWEGAIIQAAGDAKIIVDFTTEGDASKGTFSLPAAAVFRWPLKISGDSSRVTFRLPMGVLFEGELKGDTISGKVPSPTGAHTDKFYLKRKPAVALPYTEEDVTFESGGVALTGTLRIPRTEGKHAAIFLLQGSGDVDRDGESFYADHFARRGIVTLVYDKRGTGSSGGDHREESFNDFAADALAGIHYLQSRKEVNRKHVGLYGRSHGGIVAPLAAALSIDVAFIINVSGAGVSPHRQVTYQAEAQMRRDGFSEAEIAEAIAYMNQKWTVARAGGEGWDSLQVATENARGKRWAERVQLATKPEDIIPNWKLQMGYDPLPALRKVRCPVLAIFGELDTLTPVIATTANYREGLGKAGNKDYTIKVFPKADHALLVWPKPDDPFHWPVLADGYMDTITNWIRKHTLKY
jgi:pimeloyl-ACP methyl ester carboxylesterase